MLRFALGRLIQSIPALVGVTLVAFVLIQLSGDITTVMLPPEATDAQRAELRARYGLDRPLPVQYVSYVGRLLRGDFGQSLTDSRPAIEVVLSRMSATLELTLAAMAIGVLLAIPLGVLAALKRDSIFDRMLTVVVVLGQSIPSFWLSMLLVLVFAVRFPLFPVSGRGGWEHLVLPAVTLATWPLTLTARLTRSGMIDVLSQDYILTARAKGLREFTIARRHALRNAMLPIVTVLGLNLGGMLGGAVVTETVFAWPGIGTLVLSTVLARDFPVVLAVLVLVATIFILINCAIDVLYVLIDPRVRTLSRG